MTIDRYGIRSEAELIAAALKLGAGDAGGPLKSEEAKIAGAHSDVTLPTADMGKIEADIQNGLDPLGFIFAELRSPDRRREDGATYTPTVIVKQMMEWAKSKPAPARIVDPGVGSARFLAAAGSAFPDAELVGIDLDPIATLMTRANLNVLGMGKRSKVLLGDFRNFAAKAKGATLYIGNPPYVRHHQISPSWKEWLSREAGLMGLKSSKLSGLHVHFFLATAVRAQPGDYGAFITSAEWLDVNYGALVRSLFVDRLGGTSLTVLEPETQPFPDALTSAAITTFEIGTSDASASVRRIADIKKLKNIGTGKKIARERLATETRWSHLTRTLERPAEGWVELGEICRVHRGTVTGANGVWIAGEHSVGLPDSVLYPSITKAREVLESGGTLKPGHKLRNVIDIPADLDELDSEERKAVVKFLKTARSMGGDKGYVARHRRAWWAVGLRSAAPIISTYMARRAPGFTVNDANARHINIAHGLYPRDAMSDELRDALVNFLQTGVSQQMGRTYAGGLTKFEPREMERLVVPSPELLLEGVGALH
ncbi:Eco57I restriction-modification methylase domain-containing protein [Paenirhodobacter enshiensis]|uniref:Eco57I restriction-modification methylase domain-containing protein n=1 Tax=Paenirhodobacter enshiensis TaxID=1105367 RepID=UPI0035B1E08D